MKIIIAISIMLFSSVVLACPNLSGAYEIPNRFIIIKQTGCSNFTQISPTKRDSFSTRVDGKKYLIENSTFYDWETDQVLNVDRYAIAVFEENKLIIDSRYLIVPVSGGQLKIITTKSEYYLNSDGNLIITLTDNNGSTTSVYERY